VTNRANLSRRAAFVIVCEQPVQGACLFGWFCWSARSLPSFSLLSDKHVAQLVEPLL